MENMLHKRAKGNKGEDIACKFLENKDFSILERNYQKKWGELDIIANKGGMLHFFEVKSVTGSSKILSDGHRPEENVDGWKIGHIKRMIETYINEKGIGNDVEFQFHVLCVYMKMNTRKASIKWLKDIIL